MPTAPPRRCTRCRQLHTQRGPHCHTCQAAAQQRRDAARGTTTQRGLGAAHRRAIRHVLATATVCAECGLPPTPDDPLTGGHITDRQAGGTNDPSNYQAEHLSCNATKRATGSHIVLVTGPPCAGKTTYVHHHAAPGDLVLDLDQIARDLGSTRHWHHDRPTLARAEHIMRGKILGVAGRRGGRAWIIRSVPDGRARGNLARLVHADQVIVLLPSGGTLVRRARERPEPLATIRAITGWQDRYTESDGDVVITSWRRKKIKQELPC